MRRGLQAGEPAGGERLADSSPVYDGILQAVGNGRVVGWVRDPSSPERRVEVTVAVDGEPVITGVAEQPRDDLIEQGLGDGAYGFELVLPERLGGPGRHTIVALAGSEQAVIKPSASFWSEGRPGSLWGETSFVPRDSKPVELPPTPVAPPAEVVEGPDGWLFEAAELAPLPAPRPAELDRLRDCFRATHAAFAEIRIPYVLVRVPAKHLAIGPAGSLYGESAERLWVEPLIDLLRDEDGVEMLDLLPVLRACARHGSSFNRTDPHWNARGAFFVGRALLKEAHKRAPALAPPPLSQLHLRDVLGYRGPLAQPIGRGSETVPHAAEESVAPEEHRLQALRMPVEDHLVGDHQTHVRLYAREGSRGPGLALVGDGCCEPLLPWLAECATRTTFFWADSPPMEPIELEMPAVVMHLVRDGALPTIAASR